jgi:hypothetical protein
MENVTGVFLRPVAKRGPIDFVIQRGLDMDRLGPSARQGSTPLGAGRLYARYARSTREELMKKMLLLFCLGLAACDGSLNGDQQRGMTEQEVTQLQGKQAPDRIIMRTCGTATPNPFPCKVHV